MATSVQIEVTLDESGLVQGVSNINKSFDQLPAHTKPAFDGISSGQLKARQELAELGYAFGIQLPSEVTKAITSIPLLGAAITGLGEAAGFGVLITGVIELGVHLDEAKAKFLSFGYDVNDFFQRAGSLLSGNGFTAGSFGLEQQAKDISDELAPVLEQYESLSAKASSAGLQGVAAIKAQADAEINALQIAQKLYDQAKYEKYGDSETYTKLVTANAAITAAGELAIRQGEQQQILKLNKDTIQQVQHLQDEANQAGLSSFAQLIAAEKSQINTTNFDLAQNGEGAQIGPADSAIRQKTDAVIKQQSEQWSEGTRQIIDQVNAQALTGVSAIDAKITQQVDAQQKAFQAAFGGSFNLFADPNNPEEQYRNQQVLIAAQELRDRLKAIYDEGDREKLLAAQQANDQISDAESKAAIASLPPWLQANAGIVESFDETVRSIQEKLQVGAITKPQAKAFSAVALEQENADLVKNFKQTRDELAGQINSIFDDITSGNLGQAVLSELKHVFSEILAQWLLTLNGMKSGGGGGGILSSIFGGIFGNGGLLGGGGTQFGPVGIGPVPLFGNAGGSGSTSGLGLSLGAASALGATAMAAPSIFAPVGSGSIPLFGSSANLSAGVGTAGAVQQQAADTILEGTLAKFFPHGLSVGGLKISGSQLAGLGAGVGLESLFAGYQKGSPLLGGLGGAAGGALTGFSIGGPLGAVIGGAIGGVAGIFSGIFGANARKQQALSLINGTFSPEITAVLTSYDQFNTDQQSAISQLTDMETQARQQLDQLGQDKLYLSNLAPQILDATDKINQTQGIRDQRAAINFAPAEFATGGTIPGFGPVPIIGHGQEEVVKMPFAGMYRADLKAMNSGLFRGTPQSGAQTIVVPVTVNAIDAKSFEGYVMSPHAALSIRKAIRTSQLANGGGGRV